jgi:hypothetical protein
MPQLKIQISFDVVLTTSNELANATELEKVILDKLAIFGSPKIKILDEQNILDFEIKTSPKIQA